MIAMDPDHSPKNTPIEAMNRVMPIDRLSTRCSMSTCCITRYLCHRLLRCKRRSAPRFSPARRHARLQCRLVLGAGEDQFQT
ncbi:hypothetical protein D3C78_1614080 [compost metagenome]